MCSIVTESLSQAVFEIFGPQHMLMNKHTNAHTENVGETLKYKHFMYKCARTPTVFIRNVDPSSILGTGEISSLSPPLPAQGRNFVPKSIGGANFRFVCKFAGG